MAGNGNAAGPSRRCPRVERKAREMLMEMAKADRSPSH